MIMGQCQMCSKSVYENQSDMTINSGVDKSSVGVMGVSEDSGCEEALASAPSVKLVVVALPSDAVATDQGAVVANGVDPDTAPPSPVDSPEPRDSGHSSSVSNSSRSNIKVDREDSVCSGNSDRESGVHKENLISEIEEISFISELRPKAFVRGIFARSASEDGCITERHPLQERNGRRASRESNHSFKDHGSSRRTSKDSSRSRRDSRDTVKSSSSSTSVSSASSMAAVIRARLNRSISLRRRQSHDCILKSSEQHQSGIPHVDPSIQQRRPRRAVSLRLPHSHNSFDSETNLPTIYADESPSTGDAPAHEEIPWHDQQHRGSESHSTSRRDSIRRALSLFHVGNGDSNHEKTKPPVKKILRQPRHLHQTVRGLSGMAIGTSNTSSRGILQRSYTVYSPTSATIRDRAYRRSYSLAD